MNEEGLVPLFEEETEQHGNNPLGFDLEFRNGQALFVLEDKTISPGLVLDKLELGIRSVSFPFDIEGGVGTLRHSRTRLERLALCLERELLERVVARIAERSGLSGLELELATGRGVLRGRWRVGRKEAPFSMAFTAEPWPHNHVRLCFYRTLFFGLPPAPPPALISVLARALEGFGARLEQAAFILFDPLKFFLRELLVKKGYKMCSLEGVHLTRVEISPTAILLQASQEVTESTIIPADPEWLQFRAGAELFSRAEQELAQGHVAEAEKLYLEGGAQEGLSVFALRRLCQLALGRLERRELLRGWLRELEGRADPGEITLLAAAAALGEGRKEQAGQLYQQAAGELQKKQLVREAVIALRLAAEYLAHTRPELATRCLEELLRLQPDNSRALRHLADLELAAGHHLRALRLLLRLVAICPHDEKGQVEIALARIWLEKLGDLTRAARALRQALVYEPGSVEARMLLARVEKAQANREQAAALLEQALEMLSSTPDRILEHQIRSELAELWRELGKPEEALAQLERVVEAESVQPDTLRQAAELALELERWPQASEYYRRLLEMGDAAPKNMRLMAAERLAEIYLQRPDGMDEARLFLEKALELDPSRLDILQQLEKIARQQEQPALLAEVLEKKAALLTEPEARLSCLLECARIRERVLGQVEQAERLFRQALELNPENAEAREALVLMLRGQHRYHELAVLLESLAAAGGKSAPRTLLEAARLRVVNLQDPHGAMLLLEKALAGGVQVVERELLEELARAGLGTKLLDLYRKIAPSEELTPLWLDLARRMIQKLKAEKASPQRLVEACKLALEIEPGELSVRKLLADLYLKLEKDDEASRQMKILLESSQLQEQEREEYLKRLADLARRRGELEEELFYLWQLYRQGKNELVERIAELLRRLGRYRELAEFYAQLAEAAQGEEAAAYWTACATVYQQRLGEPEQAAAGFRRALEAAPQSPAAEARLVSWQRLELERGNFQQVAELMRRRAELMPPARRSALLSALGTLFMTRLGDPEKAAAAWQEALQVDPQRRYAAAQLVRYYENKNDYPLVVKFARMALQPQNPPLVRELVAELTLAGARAAWQMQSLDEAEEFYRRHLEAFADRGYAGAAEEAWDRVEMILRGRKEHSRLALHLQRRLRIPLAEERRLAAERQLAILFFEHLERPQEALELLEGILARNENDQSTVELLIEMLKRSQRWERLAEVLEAQWERAPGPEGKRARLRLLGETYQSKLFLPERAADCFRKLVELGESGAEEQLLIALRQLERLSELGQLLEKRLLTEGEKGREELLRELINIYQRLRDADSELRYRRQLMELRPEEYEQFVDACRRFQKTELGRLALEEVAEKIEDEEVRRNLWLRRAELCLEEPRDLADAARSYKLALQLRPELETAKRALELYRQLGDAEGQADILELLIDLESENEKKAVRFFELAELYLEKFSSSESARAALKQAWSLAPNEKIGQRLEKLLAAERRFGELAQLQAERANGLTGKEGALRWLEAAENFFLSGQPEKACEALERARLLDADNRPAWLAQLELWAREERWIEIIEELKKGAGGRLFGPELERILLCAAIYIKEGTHRLSLLQLLRQVGLASVEHTKELALLYEKNGLEDQARQLWKELEKWVDHLRSEERLEIFKKLASFARQSGDRQLAESYLQHCLELDPGDFDVQRQLYELYTEGERFQDLAGFLRGLSFLPPEQRSADLLLKGARVLSRSGLEQEAIDILENLVRVEPQQVQAWESLIALLGAAGQWEKVVSNLENYLHQEEDGVKRVHWLFELGQICGEHLKDENRARSYFERCLELDPEHPGALENLAEMEYRARNWQAAEDLYLRLGDRGLQASRFMMYYRLGEIAASRGDWALARQRLEQAKQLNPIFLPTRQLLCRVLVELQDFEKAAAEVEEFIALVSREGFQELELQLLHLLIDVRRKMLDFAVCEKPLMRILEISGEHLESLTELRRLLIVQGRWVEAASCLEREIRIDPSAEKWELLGQIREKLGDTQGALQAYLQAWNFQPQGERLLDELSKVVLNLGDDQVLLDLGPLIFQSHTRPQSKVMLAKALAEALGRQGRTAEAVEWAEKVLDRELEIAFLEKLAQWYRLLGRYDRYLPLVGQLLENRLAQGAERRTIAAGYRELAELYWGKLSDLERALAACRRAVELEPDEPAFLRQLGVLYACSFDTYQQAITVFRQLLARQPTDTELYRYLARLEGARGRVWRAQAYYQAVAYFAPGDGEASRYLEPVSAPPLRRPLSAAEWDGLILHPNADCLLQRIFALISPIVEPLFPRQESLWKQSRPLASDEFPHLKETIAQMARILGGRPAELRLVESSQLRSWLDFDSRPVIILTRAVAELPRPQACFWVAGEEAQVAMGHLLARRLNRSDFEILLKLLQILGRQQTPDNLALPSGALAYLKAMERSISGELMERIRPILSAYALEPRVHSVERWRYGVARTAERAALVLLGDLSAALPMVDLWSGQAERDAVRLELLRFAFCEEYLSLRERASRSDQ